MPAVICRFDVNRRVMLYTSAQIERLTGEPASSWVGAEGYARWSSSMIGATRPDWEQLGRENIAWQNRYQWRRADGELRWFRSITRIVAPGVVQSIVFDATEDVERDQELALEQRRYKTLVEQMPMVTLRADGNGVVEYVSPQVEELFGTSPEEFIREVNSENWLEMIHPADRRRVAEFVDLGQDCGDEVHELELRVQTRRRRVPRHAAAPRPDRRPGNGVRPLLPQRRDRHLGAPSGRGAQPGGRRSAGARQRGGAGAAGRGAARRHAPGDDRGAAAAAARAARAAHPGVGRRDAGGRDRPHPPADVRDPPGGAGAGGPGGDDLAGGTRGSLAVGPGRHRDRAPVPDGGGALLPVAARADRECPQALAGQDVAGHRPRVRRPAGVHRGGRRRRIRHRPGDGRLRLPCRAGHGGRAAAPGRRRRRDRQQHRRRHRDPDDAAGRAARAGGCEHRRRDNLSVGGSRRS